MTSVVSRISRYVRVLFEGKYVHLNPLFFLYSPFAYADDPVTKQSILRNIAKNRTLTVFVETGTYKGDTTYQLRNDFKKMYSIELDKKLHKNAVKMFAKFKHIELLQGDSGKVIPLVLKKLKVPALFYLDGHYSRGITAKADLDTPIVAEILAVLKHPVKGHVVLIDDERLFVGKNDYPTLYSMRKIVKSINPNLKFIVKNDMIRIYE